MVVVEEDFKKNKITAQRRDEIKEFGEDGYRQLKNFPNYMIHPDGMVWALARWVPPGRGRCRKEGGYLSTDRGSVTIYNEDGVNATSVAGLIDITFGKTTFVVPREFVEMVERAVSDLISADDPIAVPWETLTKIKDTCVEVLDGGDV
jgi:hypothetical protein